MEVTNTNVYNLAEALVASGLPMNADFNAENFHENVNRLYEANVMFDEEYNGHPTHLSEIKRAIRLVNAGDDNSGHKNFLTGILVSFNVTASNVWWMQFERYHFIQIVSSQSKMHKLKQLAFNDNATRLLDDDTVQRIKDDIELYEDGVINEENLIYSCPMGLQLTAHCTTNYMQLRTIYKQRKSHKLPEWKKFCDWIKTLPYAEEFITGKEDGKSN